MVKIRLALAGFLSAAVLHAGPRWRPTHTNRCFMAPCRVGHTP